MELIIFITVTQWTTFLPHSSLNNVKQCWSWTRFFNLDQKALRFKQMIMQVRYIWDMRLSVHVSKEQFQKLLKLLEIFPLTPIVLHSILYGISSAYIYLCLYPFLNYLYFLPLDFGVVFSKRWKASQSQLLIFL